MNNNDDIGTGTYTLTSRVIPHEVRRQGLNQEDPCPGDMVEFTCTRSESSNAAVAWTADGEPLYDFVIPRDIGTSRANQSSLPGITGILINETTLKLFVDLATLNSGINGSGIACEDVVSRSLSEIKTMQVIGKDYHTNNILIIVYFFNTAVSKLIIILLLF